MKSIKIFAQNISLAEAKKIKSFQDSKFKSAGNKDYAIKIESSDNFKINGKGRPGTFVVVAYLKSTLKTIVRKARVIIKKVASTIQTPIQKGKAKKIQTHKAILTPIKRIIGINVDTSATYWIWKFFTTTKPNTHDPASIQ